MLYDVGEILYLLDDERAQIVTLCVEEQIVKKSKSGESVLYVVRSIEGDRRTVDLSKVKVYKTPSDIERIMVERATAAISELVALTVQRAETAFGVQVEKIPEQVVPSPVEVDNLQITLPDGRVARLRASNVVQEMLQK